MPLIQANGLWKPVFTQISLVIFILLLPFPQETNSYIQFCIFFLSKQVASSLSNLCVLMFPPRMLFAGVPSNATQWGIISCQCSSTKRGANLHLKWHIVVGLGTNRGQEKSGGFCEYRNTRAVSYLFVLILRSVLSNQLYYSHWWAQQGCWNVLGFCFFFFCFYFFPPNFA